MNALAKIRSHLANSASFLPFACASIALAAGLGCWRCQAQAAPPTPQGPARATGGVAADANLTAVLGDPKYASLFRNDLDRDIARHYVFYERIPRQRLDEFWATRENIRQFDKITLGKEAEELLNDSRLAAVRERRSEVQELLREYMQSEELISNDKTRIGVFWRPARLWSTEGKQHRLFLASLQEPAVSVPMSNALEVIIALLGPSHDQSNSARDFLVFGGARPAKPTHNVSLPPRYDGIATVAIAVFETDDDLIVVCQDGSVVRIPEGPSNGERSGQLNARALAGTAAPKDSPVAFVSLESDGPVNHQVVIEVDDRMNGPKLIARNLPINELQKPTAKMEPEDPGRLPSLFWAGCVIGPEMRLWAYRLESNELIGFSGDGRTEFRAKLLEPTDHDCLRGASIALQPIGLTSLFGNLPGTRGREPLISRRLGAVVADLTCEDVGKDPFRRLVRVVPWHGTQWVLYPEFRVGNLVMRKIERKQFGSRIPVPSLGRTVDFEPLVTPDGIFLATRETDPKTKTMRCRAYEIRSGKWQAIEDWHEPTEQKLKFAVALDDGKPTVYDVTTAMPFRFGHHELLPISRR
jgi:hypothetical protein